MSLTDRQTDRQTVVRTDAWQLHRICSSYYAGSANNCYVVGGQWGTKRLSGDVGQFLRPPYNSMQGFRQNRIHHVSKICHLCYGLLYNIMIINVQLLTRHLSVDSTKERIAGGITSMYAEAVASNACDLFVTPKAPTFYYFYGCIIACPFPPSHSLSIVSPSSFHPNYVRKWPLLAVLSRTSVWALYYRTITWNRKLKSTNEKFARITVRPAVWVAALNELISM